MSASSAAPDHIQITETMVRLYVFLSQYLDRCLDEAVRNTFPEADLQSHLSDTRAKAMDVLRVNPVVKRKVAEECDRVLAVGASCLKAGGTQSTGTDMVKAERAILKNKTIALSDLLAVFRAA
jgi:hypothetical protein